MSRVTDFDDVYAGSRDRLLLQLYAYCGRCRRGRRRAQRGVHHREPPLASRRLARERRRLAPATRGTPPRRPARGREPARRVGRPSQQNARLLATLARARPDQPPAAHRAPPRQPGPVCRRPRGRPHRRRRRAGPRPGVVGPAQQGRGHDARRPAGRAVPARATTSTGLDAGTGQVAAPRRGATSLRGGRPRRRRGRRDRRRRRDARCIAAARRRPGRGPPPDDHRPTTTHDADGPSAEARPERTCSRPPRSPDVDVAAGAGWRVLPSTSPPTDDQRVRRLPVQAADNPPPNSSWVRDFATGSGAAPQPASAGAPARSRPRSRRIRAYRQIIAGFALCEGHQLRRLLAGRACSATAPTSSGCSSPASAAPWSRTSSSRRPARPSPSSPSMSPAGEPSALSPPELVELAGSAVNQVCSEVAGGCAFPPYTDHRASGHRPTRRPAASCRSWTCRWCPGVLAAVGRHRSRRG